MFLDSILGFQLCVVSKCVLALLFCYIPDLDSRVTGRSGNLKAGNSCMQNNQINIDKCIYPRWS